MRLPRVVTRDLDKTKWNTPVSAIPPKAIVYADFTKCSYANIRFFWHARTTPKGTPMCFELECVTAKQEFADGGAMVTYVPGKRMEGKGGKLRPLPRGAPSYNIYETGIECWMGF